MINSGKKAKDLIMKDFYHAMGWDIYEMEVRATFQTKDWKELCNPDNTQIGDEFTRQVQEKFGKRRSFAWCDLPGQTKIIHISKEEFQIIAKIQVQLNLTEEDIEWYNNNPNYSELRIKPSSPRIF